MGERYPCCLREWHAHSHNTGCVSCVSPYVYTQTSHCSANLFCSFMGTKCPNTNMYPELASAQLRILTSLRYACVNLVQQPSAAPRRKNDSCAQISFVRSDDPHGDFNLRSLEPLQFHSAEHRRQTHAPGRFQRKSNPHGQRSQPMRIHSSIFRARGYLREI